MTSPMDESGQMELRDVETDETYEVVDYIDEELAAKLSALSAGEAVNLELLAGTAESDVFGAVRIESSGPSARFQ